VRDAGVHDSANAGIPDGTTPGGDGDSNSAQFQGGIVSEDQLEEMGPIDYIVIEWPGRQPTGEAAPLIVDLVERGIIRILDVAFVVKGDDGTIATIEAAEVGGEFAVMDGASSGLIGDDELQDAAEVLEPGTSAAILVWENLWAAPIATAIRRSGGQLVASGRIPIQAILASLEAMESETESTTGA
jgi:uncharacterized membrane protein